MANAIGGKGTQSWGEYVMRIPENEYAVLMKLLPDLNARNADTRHVAWKKFINSPLADAYRVARSPSQVKRSNNHRIHVR